jgi:putative ABC transport system permease protein
VFNLILIVAWRNFIRDKMTTAIQLFGLIIGLACFILIQQYVNHQNSYNQQFTDAKSIYRVNLQRDDNRPQASTTLALAKTLESNFTQIDSVTRVSRSNISVKHQQSVFSERGIYADSNYFNFFDFELIEGDINTALDAPESLVLHEALAIKYFAKSSGVIGSRLTINGREHQVTAVVKQTNSPNTMPATLLIPMKNFYELLPAPDWAEHWNYSATVTFVKITDSTNLSALATNISRYYDSRTKGISSYKKRQITFDPLREIYLNNEVSYTLVPPGSATMVNVFSIISFMILVLACVNFTNLSTAAAMRRGKDVGVRKAIGASKNQLITQYLIESVLLTALATFLSLVVVEVCLPSFNQLMTAEIELNYSLYFISKIVGVTLLVGIISGGYPAFFLSSLSPAHVLKGLVTSSKSGVVLRQSLIILQFAIAAFLVVTSLAVNWQMKFVKNMPQGFDRENVLIVSYGEKIYPSFKNQVIRHPDVISTSMSHTVPTKSIRTSNTVRRLDDIATEIWTGNNPVHYDFFKTFGIKLLSGRDFSEGYTNDAYEENKDDWQSSTGKLIINNTLATTLGWSPEEAIGQILTLGGGNDGLHNHQIIAVVEDTHYVNAKNVVPPMTYVLSANPQKRPLRWVSIRLKAGSSLQAIKDIEQMWLGLDGKLAFKYNWLSDLFSASYRNENQQTTLLNIFTIIAITVTAIGLFGLAAFNTQRRIKEIAIRKILGASNGQLCFMLVNQFSSLVLLANLIALPIAYLLIRDWLNDFIYRIAMPYGAFLFSAVFCLIIAYITVIAVAFKAATAKPIDSLTCE